MSLLSFQNVTKRYPAGRVHVAVLDSVSFEVEDSDFVGIQGERRSGKSTLMKIAAGWDVDYDGGVVFDGHLLAQISGRERAKLRRRGGVGLASGDWRPLCNKSAIRHVAEVLLCDDLSMREATEPAYRALEQVGLADCAYMPSDRLSQGELIRLGLAQRLVHAPRLLLVDDPAALLKQSEATALYELLAALGRDASMALVIASEELTPIRMAKRRMSLDQGSLRSMDKPGTVVDFPYERVSAGQLSRP